MTQKKHKSGRPKLPKSQIRGVVGIRLTEAERRNFAERAASTGLSLSDWIRVTLKRAELFFYPDSLSEIGKGVNDLHHRLRKARGRAGLTQAQVAKLLDVHRPTISDIEMGRRKVTTDELSRFAKIYEVNPVWLLGEEEALTIEEISQFRD